VSAALARRVPGSFAQGGGCEAVPIYCGKAAARFFFSQRSGVIADFGDDAAFHLSKTSYPSLMHDEHRNHAGNEHCQK
jgi:hypothetical protein